MRANLKKIIDNEKLITGIVFVFFLFMMLFRLTYSALWGDEWVEYRYSQASIMDGLLYRRIIGTYQPPLYNFIMHFWLKVSQNILWFRLFNVVLGCFVFWFVRATLKTLFNYKVALISLTVLACTYQWIMVTQECSEYALMLFGLFGALMFYVKCLDEFSYFRMGGFILFCICAIYSQYGAVFVALPLLALFFFRYILDKNVAKNRKLIISGSYLFSLAAFGLPLYFFFLKLQMESNAISDNNLPFSPEMLYDLPFQFGKTLLYFFDLHKEDFWLYLFEVLGILLLVMAVRALICNKPGWIKSSLIICLLFAYVAHFLLVKLHIYAMVHPDESAGFATRYSYFFIPLLCVTLPIIICTQLEDIRKLNIYVRYTSYTLLLCVVILSFGNTLENWHKTWDNVFEKIWMENEGWKDTTILFGKPEWGYEYYITHDKAYQEGYLDNTVKIEDIDIDNLPDRFWTWRLNWMGESYPETIDKVKEQGYTVVVYGDYGGKGQLAFCYKE